MKRAGYIIFGLVILASFFAPSTSNAQGATVPEPEQASWASNTLDGLTSSTKETADTGSDGYYTLNGDNYDKVYGTYWGSTVWSRTQRYLKKSGNLTLEYSTEGDEPEFYAGPKNDTIRAIYIKNPNGDIAKYPVPRELNASDALEDAYIRKALLQQGYQNPDPIIQASKALNINQRIDDGVSYLNEVNKLNKEIETLRASNPNDPRIAELTRQRDAARESARQASGDVSRTNEALRNAKINAVGFSNCSQAIKGSISGNWVGDAGAWPGCIAAFTDLFLQAASLFLGVATAVFDFTIDFTINKFSSNYSKVESSVEAVWTLLKNLSNIIFIAAILYIAIKTILNANGFNEQKTLGKIIGMAILINFSLLFTKLAIDASNYVTTEIYKGITSSVEGVTPYRVQAGNSQATGTGKDSLAAAFMHQMRITNVYGANESGITSGNILTNSIMAIVFVAVAIFVFLAASLMLLYRFVVLIILMMTSPIAFVGGIFPAAGDKAKEWWKTLKDNCIFAPVLMLMFYITLQLMTFVKQTINDSPTDIVATMVNYILTITCMILSLVVAKAAGGHAGAADWGIKNAKMSSVGLGGAGLRGSVGQLGKKVDDYFGKQKWGNSRLGMAFREATTKGLAENKFGTSMSAVDSAKQAKERQGKKDTIQSQRDIKTAVRSTVGNTAQQAVAKLNNNQVVGLGGSTLADESVAKHLNGSQLEAVMKADKEKISDGEKAKIVAAKFKDLGAKVSANADQNTLVPPDPSGPNANQDADVKNIVKNLSDKELEYVPENIVSNAAFQRSLNSKQVDVLVKAGKLSKAQASEIKKGKTDALQKAVDANDATKIKDYLKALTATEASELDKSLLLDDKVIPHIPIAVLDKMKDKINDTERSNVYSIVTGLTSTDPQTLAKKTWINNPNNGYL